MSGRLRFYSLSGGLICILLSIGYWVWCLPQDEDLVRHATQHMPSWTLPVSHSSFRADLPPLEPLFQQSSVADVAQPLNAPPIPEGIETRGHAVPNTGNLAVGTLVRLLGNPPYSALAGLWLP